MRESDQSIELFNVYDYVNLIKELRDANIDFSGAVFPNDSETKYIIYVH